MIRIHCLTYRDHRLRFLTGPRFEGDLPWWFAGDVLDCVADLLGRPDRKALMLQHLLAACRCEDRVDVADPGGDAELHVAISEAASHSIANTAEGRSPWHAAKTSW